jgi:hypothetical protein
MDGVLYRHLSGSNELKAPLILACRHGENSAAVQRFIDLVQRPADGVDKEV